MNGNGKPSVKRISEITGFSTATVSNALNMKKGVNKETAERIFQVAEEIGYLSASKELRSIRFVLFRRNGAIVDGSTFHPFVIEGVEQEAKENGLSTLFVQLDYHAENYEEQLNKILMEANSGVMINNMDSSLHVVDYLVEQGHRKIGYIRGSYRIQAFWSREYGYRQGMLNHGLEVRPEWVVTVGTKTETACADMMKWMETKPELPTAFFVDDDQIAYGIMQALVKNGIRIPEDISIVGFDDLAYSAVSVPALTTIRVHKQEMGREAVRRLLTCTSGRKERVKVEICTDFIERESVCRIR